MEGGGGGVAVTGECARDLSSFPFAPRDVMMNVHVG